MRLLRTLVAAIVLAGAAAPCLSAQWPAHPTPGVPRTPDGKPNLSAPAPRTSDGTPDLSGLWENTWMIRTRRQTPTPSPTTGGPPVATFANVGAGFADGLLPLQPWAADLLKKRHEDNSKDNPDAHCLPMGLMQFHLHPQPRRIIQTPTLIAILYEGNAGPKAYTKPFTVRVDQRIMIDTEMIEFICNENNRDPQHMIGK